MITTIKMALKASTFFQSTQVENTDVSSAYDQNEAINQPKVLNQVNCVPLANGIKSASIHAASLSSTVLDENGIPTVLNLGPSTELTSIIDKNGNLGYMLMDKSADSQVTTDIYLRSTATSNQLRKYATVLNDNRYEFNTHSVFQNRSLFAGLPEISYHVANTEIPHPDAVDPAVGDFFDVDLATQSLTRYNLLNIGADVLDSIQCVTSYQNYMLLFTRNRLYWSCPTDAFDFTPTTGGGGSTAIAEVRGDILAVLPSDSGFIIYCRDNIVVGRFTGSTANPFTFREIKGSSGLIMRGEEPLLVRNETNQAHFAVLVSGLCAVTETEVQPLGDLVRRFVANDFTEVRRAGTGIVDQINTTTAGQQVSKIKRLYSYGTKLFLMVETATTLEDMLYVYDVSDQSIGILYGDYIAVTPRLTEAASSSDLYLQRKASAITDAFVLLRRVGNGTVAFDVMDFGNKSDIDLALGVTTSEVLIGEISLSPDSSTIVESVRLDGRLQQYDETDPRYDPTGADRVRVFGYSDWYGTDSLLEFEYNEADNRYYGGIEGPNVRILVQGTHFYLTGAELRVNSGLTI